MCLCPSCSQCGVSELVPVCGMDGNELQGHTFHKLLLLLLSVVAAVSGDSHFPVSGFLGEQVVLPCTYKGNVPVSDLQVIWGTPKREFLHKFVNGNDDLTQQVPRFRNRTKLFRDQLEQGNWSVLLSDLRESDQSEYECQIYKRIDKQIHLEKVDSVDLFVTGDSPVPVSGFLGEQVVLPCTYKGNVTISDLLGIWGTTKGDILHRVVNGNDDLTQQDPRFRNRTKLFKDQLEQGNWSVLLSDLRESDQNQYQCQIYKRTSTRYYWEQFDLVYLSVTGPGPSTGARVGLGIGILVAVFVVAGIGIYIFRKRQRRQPTRYSMNQNETSNDVPLTGETC
ncbi:junctional adhesion molecule-like [Mustelus asterias]